MVTLGAFDGIHLGHQALLRRAVELARARGVPAVGYTFHPHPAKILAPEAAPRTLIGLPERIRRMQAFGLDLVVVEPFDRGFAQVSAEAFVSDYLVAPLAPLEVVVGFNFAFGRGRGGNLDLLRREGERCGFGVHVLPRVELEGGAVSSTRVREALTAGDLNLAERLLGRRHALTGAVGGGDRRGRQLGFPTANLEPEQELIPAHGVYATRVARLGAGDAELERWDGITNIGRRPTFDGEQVTVETHLFDFAGELYGARLRVELVARLRPERRFDGVVALMAQMREDAAQARSLLSACAGSPG